MALVVGISFRRVGKVYYFDPAELELSEGDFIIAETARGVEFGEVMMGPTEVREEELVAPLKKVVRKANGDDIERAASNRESESRAFDICQRKILQHGLEMKLVEAECAFDGSEIVFSFCADERVDFRELVKDLAGTLKTRVQLHQIGARDEAKLIGGFGACGRELCCTSFLSSFDAISMKMAKDQCLFLNPAKFSGVCGKLMCCLRYEHDFYKDARQHLPSAGAVVQTERGKGKVTDVNVFTGMLTVEVAEDHAILNIPAKDLNLVGCCRKHGCDCPMQGSNCKPILAAPAE